jgi:ABC-type lipoprotein release transport system permease subunit
LALGTGQQIWPAPEFTLGIAVLCVIAAIVASAIPALIAITQDPVKALRTP